MKEESAKKIVKVFSVISMIIGIFFTFAFILLNIFNYIDSGAFPFSYLYFFGNLIIMICLLIGGIELWKFKNFGKKLVLASVFIYILETGYSFASGVYVTRNVFYIIQRIVEQGFFSFFVAAAI